MMSKYICLSSAKNTNTLNNFALKWLRDSKSPDLGGIRDGKIQGNLWNHIKYRKMK